MTKYHINCNIFTGAKEVNQVLPEPIEAETPEAALNLLAAQLDEKNPGWTAIGIENGKPVLLFQSPILFCLSIRTYSVISES